MFCLPALDYLLSCPDDPLLRTLRGRRVGLLTNHTGVTVDGIAALDVLTQLGLSVRALFSPEHGFAGTQEGDVASTVVRDLPVHSLYGATRQPTAEMLAEIDVLICDLQDVGARFYTYSSTLALAMEVCAAQHVQVVVLDRPNPLGGAAVAGPLRDAANISFIGHLNIPIIHGMTMGELAQLHASNKALDIDLQIVPVRGWKRDLLWPQLLLPWRVPSPNLPDFTSAAWYAGLCLLEFSGVSVGRGTAAPFQILGAPWLDPAKVLSALSESIKSTFTIHPLEFTPTRGKWENEPCKGLQFDADILPDPQQVIALGMALLAALHQVHTEFDIEKALPLLGSSQVLEMLKRGEVERAQRQASGDAAQFREKRMPFLMKEYDV